jgi:uncharacterized protein YunC (DUF1805 family)
MSVRDIILGMDLVEVNGNQHQAYELKTSHANILLIKARQGFLGCGYFRVETADKLGEPVAIVTGVKTYEEMLSAKVVRLSQAARQIGIVEGISGREALGLLQGNSPELP